MVRYRFGDDAELMGAWRSARNVLGPFKTKNAPGAGGSGEARWRGWLARLVGLLLQELNDSQHQRCSRRRLRNPEAEQALGKTRLQLSDPLLELPTKSRERERAQLPDAQPIRGI